MQVEKVADRGPVTEFEITNTEPEDVAEPSQSLLDFAKQAGLTYINGFTKDEFHEQVQEQFAVG